MPTPDILLASGNPHKIEELSILLRTPLRGLRDLPRVPEIVEDAETFEGNALKKARTLAPFTQGWVLADDSGLEVDALNGAPGVHSARFAGEHGNDAANNALLLQKLHHTSHRTARFVCVLVLLGPNDTTHVVRGTCEGSIALTPAGNSGFGYDPLFIPDGYTQTFAELGDTIKARISHRAHAVQTLQPILATLT